MGFDRFDAIELRAWLRGLRRRITAEKVVLTLGAACVAMAVLFPPWIRPNTSGSLVGAGRGFVVVAPILPDPRAQAWIWNARVHSSHLATEIAGIAFVTGALYLVTRPRRGDS